jgi:hypothetical protein
MEKNIIWAHILEPGLEHLHYYEVNNAKTINSLIVRLKRTSLFAFTMKLSVILRGESASCTSTH